MKTAKYLLLLAVLLLCACARPPARCERPVGLAPEAPRAGESRRLVASLDAGGACHVKVRVPEATAPEAWNAARDAALASAEVAAQTCCTTPRASNVDEWVSGETVFDVKYECAASARR